MHKFIASTEHCAMPSIGFLLVYLLGMIPTYILPYFGSNSFFAQMWSGVFTGGLLLVGTICHLGALAVCIYAAWARGQINGSKALVALPVVATVFDFVPVLSAIPLVPTVMHIIALVKGFSGSNDYPEDRTLPTLAERPLLGLAIIASLVATLSAGVVLMSSKYMQTVFGGHQKTTMGSPTALDSFSSLTKQHSTTSRNSVAPAQPQPPSTLTAAAQVANAGLAPNLNISATTASPAYFDACEGFTGMQASGCQQKAFGIKSAGGVSEDDVNSKLQQLRNDLLKAEEEHKARIAAADQANAMLNSSEGQKMARAYVESYIHYVEAGDYIGAERVLGESSDETSRDLYQRLFRWGHLQKIEYDYVSFERNQDPTLPGMLKLRGLLKGVNSDPDALGRYNPIQTTFDFFLTLDETGTKLVSQSVMNERRSRLQR